MVKKKLNSVLGIQETKKDLVPTISIPNYTTLMNSSEGTLQCLHFKFKFFKRAQAIVKEPVSGPKDYKPKFRILLVRHGLSEANVDKNLYKTMSDHAIPVFP